MYQLYHLGFLAIAPLRNRGRVREQQRLLQIYRKKGLDAILEELKNF